jgi:hypothetical protein
MISHPEVKPGKAQEDKFAKINDLKLDKLRLS